MANNSYNFAVRDKRNNLSQSSTMGLETTKGERERETKRDKERQREIEQEKEEERFAYTYIYILESSGRAPRGLDSSIFTVEVSLPVHRANAKHNRHSNHHIASLKEALPIKRWYAIPSHIQHLCLSSCSYTSV